MASISVPPPSIDERRYQAGLVQAILITCITSLPAIAIVSLVPAIPLLLRQFAGVPYASVVVPLIVTAPGICIAALSPFFGELADRFGRRPMVLGALVFYGLIGCVPLLATDIRVIIGSRVLLGASESVLVTVGYALISDYYPPAERGKWLALQATLGSIVGAVLTFAGGLLAELSWRGPFAVYLVAFLILAAAMIWLWEPQRSPSEATPAPGHVDAFPWRAMGLVAAVTLFSATLFYGYIIQIGIALDRLGLQNSGAIGIISGVAALAVIIGAMLSRVVIRFPIGLQFLLVFAVIGTGLVAIGLARSWQVAAVGAFTQQLGAGLLIPVLVAWTHSFLTFAHRNRGTGVFTAAFFLGQFTCPLAVGAIRMAVPDQQTAIAALGACSLVAAAIGLFFTRSSTGARA